MAVLEVSGLGIRFGGLQALQGLTFRVDEYEIVGLIGPNGAGKTTAFDCITGYATPSSGTVTYRGRDITRLRPDQRAALGIGRTFQQVGAVRTMTVLDTLLTAQHARIRYSALGGLVGWPPARIEERRLRERALQALEFMGLTEDAGTRLDGLPYGTLRVVDAAAVLASDPDLLLLDEPSAGMSPAEAHDFGRLLLDIRRQLGGTIVMTEHHVPMVLAVCDYVYVLNFGRLLAEGLPREVQSHPAVVAAYLGREDADDTA